MQGSKKLFWTMGLILSINFFVVGFFSGVFYEKTLYNEEKQRLKEENDSLAELIGEGKIPLDAWRKVPDFREKATDIMLKEKGIIGILAKKDESLGLLRTRMGLVRIEVKKDVKKTFDKIEIGTEIIVFGKIKDEDFGKIILVEKIKKI